MFSFHQHVPKSFHYKWDREETITLPNGSQLKMGEEIKDFELGKEYFILDSQTQFPLFIRTRKDGDRIQLKGMTGSKKIKSLFIDHKIQKFEREEWPIVTDKNGNILWVPLLRKSKYEANQQADEHFIVLKYIKS